VLRDIVLNEIPTAFRDHRPYAVCAFVGGWVLVAALLLAAATASGLRLLALASGWTLPAWGAGQDEGRRG
jgi:uncharacterized membrane protein YeiH